MNRLVGDAVRALAAGDFTMFADRFGGAGLPTSMPAPGIVQIGAGAPPASRLRLLISVGVHGDETAPIELLAQLLADLAQQPRALAADLMLAVGNPAAIAAGRRYLDSDLNRLFRVERGALQAAAETARADCLMRAAAEFFAPSGAAKWHLDLHTAIRASLYPTFALLPELIADAEKSALIAWLGGAGIDAVILNRKPAGTFSAYTAAECGAVACTVELGRVAALGSNDLSRFAAMRAALQALLRTGRAVPLRHNPPHEFSVAQEIVKHSERFDLACDRATGNFTAMAPGAVIARDGELVYRVGAATEYIVFPNPDVAPGQRAGLMLGRRAT